MFAVNGQTIFRHGLVYEKKTWTYKKDIDVRNRTEVKAIKWKPKDAENRKLETIIPMRK